MTLLMTHLCLGTRVTEDATLRSQEMRIPLRTQFRTPRCFFTVAYKTKLFIGPKALVLEWHYPSQEDI